MIFFLLCAVGNQVWIHVMNIYTVSQKMHQLWNGIAKNYKDQFWWNLAEILKSL